MKTTQKKRVKDAISANRELIQTFTEMGDEAYNTLFFDLAMAWAEQFTTDTEYLTKEGMFWGFWTIEYDKMNERFLAAIKSGGKGMPDYYMIVSGNEFTACITTPRNFLAYYKIYAKDSMTHCKANNRLMEVAFHKALKK